MIETQPALLHNGPLTAKAIARFHLPLVLNAWLMALVGPVINVALARSVEPRLHLAAFWLAFSILLLAQSACMVMQQASAVALRRRMNLFSIWKASALLGVLASGLVLVVGATPVGGWVFRAILPAESHTAALTRAALIVLSPVPILVVLRGVAAGIATVERRTEVLAIATATRVLVLAAIAVTVMRSSFGMSAVIASWAMVLGTAAEAMVMLALVLWSGRKRSVAPCGEAVAPIFQILLPLATASLVWTAVRPLVGSVLGHLDHPERAQAAFGVVFPLLMLSCAPLWGFFEAAVVLPHEPRDVLRLLRFALFTSLAFAAVIAVMMASPFRNMVLHDIFALTPELERAVLPALGLIALEPVVLSMRAIAQGLLLRAGHSGVLLTLSPIKLALIGLTGFVVVRIMPNANGAVLALLLILGGEVVDLVLYGAAVIHLRAIQPVVTATSNRTLGQALRQEAA